jgi:hypothetical protein
MMCVLLWLLPVVDVFALRRILKYYSSLGVQVPWSHAKAGVIERWIGYMPAGFIVSWVAGFRAAFLIALAILGLIGPVEFYLMCRGVRPWKFFARKPVKSTAKIFLLEGYNAIGYYLLGATLAALLST